MMLNLDKLVLDLPKINMNACADILQTPDILELKIKILYFGT